MADFHAHLVELHGRSDDPVAQIAAYRWQDRELPEAAKAVGIALPLGLLRIFPTLPPPRSPSIRTLLADRSAHSRVVEADDDSSLKSFGARRKTGWWR